MNAKKPPKKEENGNSPRKAKMDREDVLRLSGKIHEVADKFGALASEMELKQVGPVGVDGYSKQSRGLELLEDFRINLNAAIERAAIR